MSRPPIDPKKSVAGIALDPLTLERVIPESKRPDGTVRRQIKIRPGFTPQEDVNRFRGTKQMQMDANALPKGHIIGWVPPPTGKSGTAANAIASDTTPISKAAKKNAKRKEKREKEKLVVPDNWEDEEGDEKSAPADNASQPASSTKSEEDRLSGKLEKLQLK